MPGIPTSIVSKALAPIVGGVGKELSGLIGDQIRLFRWKNAVRILERAKRFADQRRVAPSQVPLKFLVPFLEGASIEDEPKGSTLVDMWANLLVSATGKFDSRFSLYVDVLKKLSSKDAAGLQTLYARFRKDDLFRDDGFDPDVWNFNDIDEVRTDLNYFVSKFCVETLDSFSEGGLSFDPSWEKNLKALIATH